VRRRHHNAQEDFHFVDVHVDARLRQRRTELGISLERLGELNGLAFQQIQKYENGINRVSPSRLYRLARLLKVPVGYFFDGLPGTEADTSDALDGHALHRRETLELADAYYRITDPKRRHAVYQFIRALTETPG
jgi:transcriptional regulator with XRE-family HTH domain